MIASVRKRCGMDWLSGTAVIVGLFALRLGVPLAITLVIGYLLHRLDAGWHPKA